MKIVLDTNVLSELAKREPEPRVEQWVSQFQAGDLWITSTTLSEVVQGVMMMPEGRRKNDVDDNMSAALGAFYERTLDFDGNAAVEYGRLLPDLAARGKTVKRSDAQIAASCLMVGAALATRNTKDFEDIPGLKTVNPWGSDT